MVDGEKQETILAQHHVPVTLYALCKTALVSF
jgi:hypothetical protein